MIHYARYVILPLCLLLLLVGCQGLRTPSAPPERLLETTESVWRRLQARRRSYQTLKGLAELRLKAPDGGGALDNTVFVLEGFSKVRLEGIGPFGQPLFLYTFAEPHFALYLPQEQLVYTGNSTSQALERLIGLAIEPLLLPYVLLGDLPLTEWPPADALTYLADDGLYYWEGAAAPWFYRVWLEPYALLPIRFELASPPQRTWLEVEYDDFQRLGGLTLPYRIAMRQPQSRRQVIWTYTDVALNTEVDASVFEMRAPPGAERVDLTKGKP
jgi:hypothetical protein